MVNAQLVFYMLPECNDDGHVLRFTAETEEDARIAALVWYRQHLGQRQTFHPNGTAFDLEVGSIH